MPFRNLVYRDMLLDFTYINQLPNNLFSSFCSILNIVKLPLKNVKQFIFVFYKTCINKGEIKDSFMDEYEEKRAKMKIVDLIRKQVDPYDATPMNVYEIRNYVYYGFSDPKLRPKYWKILLNYYSSNKFKTEMFYKQARTSYHEILKGIEPEDSRLDDISAIIKPEIERSALINANETLACYKEPIERILASFCVINPGIGYVQGMINLAFIFYHVLRQEDDLEELKYVEEDAFYLFNNLVSEMSNLFIAELDNGKRGLKDKVSEIFEIIKVKDPELHKAMTKKELDKSMFPVKWILLLFTSEYEIEDTLWLWDRILSDAYRFEMLSYLSATIVILMRDILLSEDFEKCMIVLQKPNLIGPKLVFEIADLMRREEKDIRLIIKERLKN